MSTMSAMHDVTLTMNDGSTVVVPMSDAQVLHDVFDPDDPDVVSFTIPVRRPVRQPSRTRTCPVCGGIEGEHDWEVHSAELRAGGGEY